MLVFLYTLVNLTTFNSLGVLACTIHKTRLTQMLLRMVGY